ncbi:MAG: phosphoadenylyl-sulfate reductase [Cytophagaceae bacterium]|nr:phosphoadenylyl-sulfate reductase [Cytophagaceae bacterium]MBL0326511.1 phosphoadenylyl-sulfate reductase [Cytophagaceae bacterium]
MNDRLNNLDLLESFREVLRQYPEGVVFSTSFGQEDQVITDLIFKNNLPIEVFTLDTGRVFQETYELMDKTRAKFKKDIKVCFPDANDIEKLTSEKGFNSFYESIENRKECCFLRKIKPLKKALAGNKVWITGLRAEQSDNRSQMQMWEFDEANDIFKFNPLLHWTQEQMEGYLEENKVPQNVLHKKGFISIGCQPCTRAIEPGEHPRAGRWWWETSHKECGLHGIKS